MKVPIHIIVVGAGPTGASLALLLARRNIAVTLLEKEPDFHRIFRGEGMMPSGIDALNQMELHEQLEQLPHRKLDTWEFYLCGKRFIKFAEPDRHHKNAIRCLSQPYLLEMLVSEAKKYPNFRFKSGFQVRDFIRKKEKVGVVGNTGSGTEEILGDYVIGTDGRASIIRKRSGIFIDRSEEDSPRNYDAVWYALPLPAWLEKEMIFYGFAAEDSLATMYSTGTSEQLRLGWLIPKGTYAKFRQMDMLEEIAKRVPTHVGHHIRKYKSNASAPSFFNVLFGKCPQWSAPGVLLLGDAAHPMNPTRAQGINLGLRDAIVAANHLVPILTQEKVNPEALDAAAVEIQKEREPEITKLQAVQLDASGPPPLFMKSFFRKTILPALVALKIPQRIFLRQDQELRYGVVPVTLKV